MKKLMVVLIVLTTVVGINNTKIYAEDIFKDTSNEITQNQEEVSKDIFGNEQDLKPVKEEAAKALNSTTGGNMQNNVQTGGLVSSTLGAQNNGITFIFCMLAITGYIIFVVRNQNGCKKEYVVRRKH